MDTPIPPSENGVNEAQRGADVDMVPETEQAKSPDVNFKSPKPALLPAFGATLPSDSHLPTPHSPGNFVSYLSSYVDCPSSSTSAFLQHPRYSLSYTPRTSHRSSSPPFASGSSEPMASVEPSTSRTMAYTQTRPQQFPSQVATPSPEISRNSARRAQFQDTPSDSEAVFMTPKVGRQEQRSSGHQYPGLIDSPYQSSPERLQEVDSSPERQHRSSPLPSHIYDPDDPFIDHQQGHCVSHMIIGSARKGTSSKPDSEITRLVRSPGASSGTGERAGVIEEDGDVDADGVEDDGEGEEVGMESVDVVMQQQPVAVPGSSSAKPIPCTPPPRSSRLAFDSPLTPHQDPLTTPLPYRHPIQSISATLSSRRPSPSVAQDSRYSPPAFTLPFPPPTHFPPAGDVVSTPPPLSENLPSTPPPLSKNLPSTPPPLSKKLPSTPPPLSRTTSLPITPPSHSILRTPSPQRGGELTRIRERQTSLDRARTAASEQRRPEYLMRSEREPEEEEEEIPLIKLRSKAKAKATISPNKRTRDAKDASTTKSGRSGKRIKVENIVDVEAGTGDMNAVPEKDRTKDNLGVTVTPVRGRRLKLYQPVPLPVKSHQPPRVLAESSAVAVPAGAVAVAVTPSGENTSEEPKTPPPLYPSTHSLALRAIDWRTPDNKDQQQQQQHREDDDRITARRLDAFRAAGPSGRGKRLKKVELAGRGRVIVDIGKPDVGGLFEALQVEGISGQEDDANGEWSQHEDGAQWPDKEYPWSEHERQRDELEETERKRRLAQIRRFLERESSSDEGDNDCIARPLLGYDPSSPPPLPSSHSRGRGKTVALNFKPTPRKGTKSKSKRRSPPGMLFGAATADARQVLMSKKHVRAVAERLRRRRIAEEEEGVVMCICQGGDDGRAMVRCDSCRVWYHLVCMDIHDPDALGDEWFCWKCLPDASEIASSVAEQQVIREPTFVPSTPDSPPRIDVGDQPFYQYLEPSPLLASPVAPAARAAGGGPLTPYLPTRYTTYEEFEHTPPFDPTSTPSRGLKFPGPAPSTPRRHALPHFWGTPSTPLFNSLPAWNGGGDESPVRRRPQATGSSLLPSSLPPPFMPTPLPRTPKGVRGRPFPGSEEASSSPTLKSFSSSHRNLKDGNDSDLSAAAMRQGKSPQRRE